MTRRQAINHLRIAGYHHDMRSFTRLYVENRVSIKTAREAFAEGERMRDGGMACTCSDCKQAPARLLRMLSEDKRP